MAELGEEGTDLLVDAVQLRMLDGSWPFFGSPEEYVGLAQMEGVQRLLKAGRGAQYLKLAQSPRSIKKQSKKVARR